VKNAILLPKKKTILKNALNDFSRMQSFSSCENLLEKMETMSTCHYTLNQVSMYRPTSYKSVSTGVQIQ